MTMKPITIEFNVKNGDTTFKEDSVTFDSAEDLFEYVAPGGGCENMPSDLGEIQMMFMSPQHPNTMNPIADKRVTLQLGIVFLTGPLSTIVQISQEVIDKMGRAELSDAFQAVIGVKT
jgi:hypothetical protein